MKEFKNPEIEVVNLQVEDVITTSNGGEAPPSGDNWTELG